METGLAAATRRADEAEGQARRLEEGMSEKDAMLKYVEEEVDRVKGAALARRARGWASGQSENRLGVCLPVRVGARPRGLATRGACRPQVCAGWIRMKRCIPLRLLLALRCVLAGIQSGVYEGHLR